MTMQNKLNNLKIHFLAIQIQIQKVYCLLVYKQSGNANINETLHKLNKLKLNTLEA